MFYKASLFAFYPFYSNQVKIRSISKMHLCLSISIYICMYTYVYLYMYIYTFTYCKCRYNTSDHHWTLVIKNFLLKCEVTSDKLQEFIIRSDFQSGLQGQYVYTPVFFAHSQWNCVTLTSRCHETLEYVSEIIHFQSSKVLLSVVCCILIL